MSRRLNRLAWSLVAALAAVGTVVSPAHAAVSVVLDVKLVNCPHDGVADAYVTIAEQISGLAGGSYSYRLIANHDIDASNSFTIVDNDSGWYAEGTAGSGYHNATVTTYAYNGGPMTVQLHPGDTFSWSLYQTYGTQTVVASGTFAVGDVPGGCGSPPSPPPAAGGTTGSAPAAASFAATPKTIKVAANGTFHVPFGAAAGLSAAVKVAAKGKTWAAGSLTVPSTGTANATLKLSKAARKVLAAKHKAAVTVTVSLSNAHGTTPASTTVKLKR